jgi:hypothetical protein
LWNFVCIDRVLLAASCLVTGADAKSGGEAGDVIYGNRSPSIAFYRHQATFFDGKYDGKLRALRQEIVLFQSLKRAGDN